MKSEFCACNTQALLLLLLLLAVPVLLLLRVPETVF
jgi:hypothetical protein